MIVVLPDLCRPKRQVTRPVRLIFGSAWPLMNTVWPGSAWPTAASISSRVSTSAQVSGSGAALADGVALALGLADAVALADPLGPAPCGSFLLFCPHPATVSTATASAA